MLNYCKIIFATLAFLSFTVHSFGQNKDTIVLTPENFIEQIKAFHPVAKLADIPLEQAAAQMQMARGGFDPVLKTTADQKTFDGKNYYNHNNAELVIPTPFAVDVKMGVENNSGQSLDPELTSGKSNYVGIQVPLTKGLLFDERRATLQQARIYNSLSRQERFNIINTLLYNAYTDYYLWAGAYQLYNVYQDFTRTAQERLRLVRIGYNNGDRAANDTLEAYVQVQNYILNQAEALIKFNKAKFNLANYLWADGEQPVQLNELVVPEEKQLYTITEPLPLEEIITSSLAQNPEFLTYELKLRSLDVDRRLKFQSLLPTLNVSANVLNKNYTDFKGFNQPFLQDNNKWKIEFKVPLFLREGRGAYKLANLKIRETDLNFTQKKRETENKIRSYYTENFLLQQQLTTAAVMNENYTRLLRNENLKFNQGESSLFLVNTREMKLLELYEKQTELRIKYILSRYSIYWAAGLLR